MGGAPGTGGGRAGAGGHAGAAGAGAGRQPDAGVADASTGVDQTKLPALTLYLVGDSTVMDYGPTSAQQGWGQELAQFLIAKVTIDDRAIGGRSVQSFMYTDATNTTETSSWLAVKNALKPGDYLMVQFGTNDSSGIAGRAVTPADFQKLLGVMIDEVKAKQATPILVTPSALQQWVGGVEENSRLAPYADAMKTLGPMKGVLVDDLNARGVALLNMIGQTASAQIYIDGDKAHFTKYGATEMASFVAQELARVGSPLAAYLAN
jgi:lysophospholipase L1-like esterase